MFKLKCSNETKIVRNRILTVALKHHTELYRKWVKHKGNNGRTE